jgi:hypothetical protein
MVVHNTPILNLTVFYNLYLLFFYYFSDVTCVHTMQGLVVFNCSEVRPEVVLAARWGHRVNLRSSIDSPTTVCYSCSFDISRLSLTVYVFKRFLYLQNENGSSFGS